MACVDPLEAFRYATEDLDQHLFRRASYMSIWMNLIRRGIYPKNVGTNRTVFGIGNIEPTTNEGGSWTPIVISTPGSGLDTSAELCTPDFNEVEWGFTEMDYGPEMYQLKGPTICRKDLTFIQDPDGFLTAYMQELAKRARRTWELNYAYHHRRLSMKAIAATDFVDHWYQQEALTSLECPTCELTQEMLELVAQRLIDDDATNPDSNGFISWGDSGPLFSLYIGADLSQRLLRQNSELRQDYRWGDPSTLIARLGAKRVIGNFRHIINQRPPRYTCDEQGNLTEVPPYADAAEADVTGGNFQVISDNYRAAPYEGVEVLSPDLFTSEVVQPTNSAGGVSFDPVSYMGEWKFVRGGYKFPSSTTACSDPLEDKGRHFAEMIHAPKPNPLARFRYGWLIIVKRCLGDSVECVDCSS